MFGLAAAGSFKEKIAFSVQGRGGGWFFRGVSHDEHSFSAANRLTDMVDQIGLKLGQYYNILAY
jgi:hypothetical protein